MRSTARPVVDLPQPLSPTSPSVSPRFNAKLTPSTAFTVADLALDDDALHEREMHLQVLDAQDLAVLARLSREPARRRR